jgi:hypothetical protein
MSPVERVTPEEWEELTGSRGSVYFGTPPVEKPKPSPESETPKKDETDELLSKR